jgi:hypothetical protein
MKSDWREDTEYLGLIIHWLNACSGMLKKEGNQHIEGSQWSAYRNHAKKLEKIRVDLVNLQKSINGKRREEEKRKRDRLAAERSKIPVIGEV